MDKTKINHIRSTIERYNSAYRTGNPIVSDAEYDELLEELRTLDPENDWFKHIEAAPVSNSRKVKLPIPMKSLDKAKNIEEIQQWIKSLGLKDQVLVITPKFDGVSLLYDQKTHKAFSRGGAENEGQDCTEHAAKVGDISEDPAMPGIRYTYGELVFSVKSWNTYFNGRTSSYSGAPYKSPRNTIAGLINREVPDEDLFYATFYRYGMDETSLSEFSRYSEMFKYLHGLCHQPLMMETCLASELNEEALHSYFDCWSKEFYIDGLVIYIDDLDLWSIVGRHQTTGNPKYAIAYKNPVFTPTFESIVKGVNWKVSKSGALKPVVNIDTVNTGDCDMENPTGYNAKYIFEHSIAAGAVVKVTRSGGVIPKILDVIEEAPTETIMQQRDDLLYCPSCGQPTTWSENAVELMCTNPNCQGILLSKIVHFYNTIGVEQIGEDTIAKMIKFGYRSLCQILDASFEDLLEIDTFGESTANTIIKANKKIRSGVDVAVLMHASDCFAGIGQIKARAILSGLSDTERFAFMNAYIRTEPGFDQSTRFFNQTKTMQSFLKGIEPFYNFLSVNKLTMLPMAAPKAPTGTKYAGMKVCFSGIRDKSLEDEIVDQGGEVVNSVSQKTTHLIVLDRNAYSSKIKKAQSLSIPILTIEEFKTL